MFIAYRLSATPLRPLSRHVVTILSCTDLWVDQCSHHQSLLESSRSPFPCPRPVKHVISLDIPYQSVHRTGVLLLLSCTDLWVDQCSHHQSLLESSRSPFPCPRPVKHVISLDIPHQSVHRTGVLLLLSSTDLCLDQCSHHQSLLESSRSPFPCLRSVLVELGCPQPMNECNDTRFQYDRYSVVHDNTIATLLNNYF